MKKIFNPTDKEIVFMYNSHEYRVLPESSDIIDFRNEPMHFHYEHLVKHVRSHVNSPLQVIDDETGDNIKQEYVPAQKSAKDVEEEEKILNPNDLEDMRWKDMVKLGSDLKVYTPGMNRPTLESAIRNARGENNG